MLNLQDPTLLKQQCFLNGQWQDAASGETIAVNNPATGEIIARVPKMGAPETEQAIASAEAALPAWRSKTAKERCAIVRRWFELVRDNADDLAIILTSEQGKPLAEAKGEVLSTASYLEWFSEEGKRAYGETIPSPWADRRIIATRSAIGVCAAITPWNFPSAMIARKAGPALAVGCTMILKPASQTPLSALALAVLAERAGVPAGVFSVLTGSAAAIGDSLCASPVVRKLSFTGSTEVGRQLMANCAPTIKKLSLELGGNAPFIVFDDADLDAAVEGAIASKFRNAGQTCVCANRLYVQAGVYDAFADKLASAVAKFKIGNGLEAGVTTGPVIDEKAVAKVEEHIADALAHGGKVIAGGKRHALGLSFFEPTIITGVTAEMAVAKEETFGPMAPLFSFEDEAEVIKHANDTEYGLASYLYTRDLGRAVRVSEALEYGMVGVNNGLMTTEVAPFGGVKQSGLGREGSRHGLEDYLEVKYICLAGI